MRKLKITDALYWKAVKILVEASLYRQHKNSFLGASWGLILPFIQIIIISYIFSFLLKQPAVTMTKNLISSLPFWTFVTSSLSAAAVSLTSRQDIIKKVIIPKTLLPVTDVLVHCYSLAYSFIAMYAGYILFFPGNFNFNFIFVLFTATPLILSVILIGIAVAYITPYLQDLPHMILVILNVVYWALPIVYPYDLIPIDKRWLFEINPLFHLIRPTQVLIIEQAFPENIIIFKALLVTALVAGFAYLIHKKLSRNVVYYL